VEIVVIEPLSTPRLVLEPQSAAHADEMFAVLSDPAIYEFGNEAPASLDWLRERFLRLESCLSPDGREKWLNWVIRLATGEAIGYVQATVLEDGRALIAYEMGSDWWGRGYGREAVGAMLDELSARFGVLEAAAVFRGDNHRSRRLLEGLHFSSPPQDSRTRYGLEPDEDVMVLLLAKRT
jgi:RimJ/RimL family protein N-acetyltransferase